MPPKRAFVALQDRFVSSLAVACCPTMDLVAVLTLDHHLLVHVRAEEPRSQSFPHRFQK